MSQLDTKGGQILFKQLGGLDERKAPYAQDGYDFQLLSGLYPARDGLLERIPGKVFLANVNGYAAADRDPIQVWNIFQPNDGSGNIIVQTDQDLRVYSLDELLDREPEETLEFSNTADEDGATMALLAHRETNGTDGGSLGQTDDIFYARKLTDILVNQSATVSAFRDYDNGAGNFTVTIATPAIFTKAAHGLAAGDSVTLVSSGDLPTGLLQKRQYYVIATGLTADDFQVSLTPGGSAVNTTGSQSGTHTLYKNASQFDLVAGTYRIEAIILFYLGGAYTNYGSVAGLFNVTDQRFEYFSGTTFPIVSSSGFLGQQDQTNSVIKISAQFTIDATKTYELRQAVKATGTTAAGNDSTATGQDPTISTGSYEEVYATIKLLKMP